MLVNHKIGKLLKSSICNVCDMLWDAVAFLDTLWLLLRFVMYLIKNVHSYLSTVFLEATLGEHLRHVGAIKHDLPCKSVEWLLHGAVFVERCF